MYSKKKTLVLVVIFSTLLLTTVPLRSVQSSGSGIDAVNDPWVAGSAGCEADVFFDDSYVHEIRLYFDDPDWYDTLYDAHDNDRNTQDPYFPARFVSHGIEIDPVGARFKGLSTFGFGGGFPWWGGGADEDIKKPFRIDFNMYDEGDGEETTFFGLKKLNLNNGALDPTLMREKLFMDFASKYVHTPRSVYTRLYINDEYYGLYLAMEHIDNTFVENRFGNDEHGNIYKAESMGTLSYLGPNPEPYNGPYELKNNEEINDWSDLIELTEVLTNTPLSDLPAQLESIFDVESGLYSLALLDLFCSLDSYIGNARNYYLYDRSDTGQFTHLLWDANLAFGKFGLIMEPGADPAEYDVFPPSTLQGFGFFPGGGPTSNLTLIQKVLAVDSYNTTYLRALAQMLREGFDAASINARIQELADLIRDEVYNDPNLWTSPSEFEPGLEETVNFVERRAAYLNTQLDAFAEKTDLQLNELMTVNQGTIADNEGDYDPWVEIYNLGPGLLNTDSLFLTDDLGVPNKWELPAQNLDDGEFLLLWLDGEPSEGDNHVPFSLNSSGGDLHLYMDNGSDYVLVDTISYPELDIDVSYGRFPDGEGSWQIMSEVVTPAGPNQLGSIPEGLVINEFMANNDAAVPGPEGDYPDWIELYNGGNESIDLSGMYLSDDLTNPTWQFPAGTVIEAGGFLVVWAENSSQSNPEYVNFNLNAQGEFICLLADDAETLIDSIAFAQQFDDISYGRRPDGTSSWNYLTPTPNLSNSLGEPVTPEDLIDTVYIPSDLFINEFMANNDAAVPGPDGNYPDWIELYNGGAELVDLSGMYLTDDLTNPNAWQFPSGTVIEPNGFLVVWADNTLFPRSMHANFGLNATGEAVGLFAEDEETQIDSIIFGAQDDDVSYGRLPDGSSSWNHLTPTPGSPNELYEPETSGNSNHAVEIPDDLFINEFMANNDAAVPGPDGTYPDWIELYNAGNESINLSGIYLSDDLANPDAWQFPSGTVLEAGGFLVVWADNSPDTGSMHASFGLNATGEAVCLFASDAETRIDSIVFTEQLNDVSYGRFPDGSSSWNYLTPTPGLTNELSEVVTPGEANHIGGIPDGLFINELMADNQITIAGPDETYPDWIELYNAGNETIDLSGMYLTDNLANPTKWRFPNDTSIGPKGYLLIWADNSSDRSSSHTSFALNANGEEVGLFASDGETLIDSVVFVKQIGDVSYGRLPDGSSNWDYLIKATPGWGNDKPRVDSETSFWSILLLIGLVIALGALLVVTGKINSRRKR
jgi:spore coat protein CotH